MLEKFQSESAISHDIEGGYTYLIAYFDGTPCGYSSIKQDNGVFLSKFYVMKAYRGKGIGKEMIRTINEYAAKHSAHRIWLTCNKHNSASLGIYEKLGFKAIDSIVTDIGGGFVMDDYVLEKDLKA
jgi:RimJ/RimL family protein N-acetyltransferase